MATEFDARRVAEMSFAHKWGVDTYAYLVDRIRQGTDVSSDEAFQRKFTSFYRVRRDATWRTEFYRLFEDLRRSGDATFPLIVTTLQKKTGQVETSFASKMLNTLKPEMPIWDRNVREFFGLKDPLGSLDRSIAYYAQLVDLFNTFSESSAGQQCVEEFNRLFPSYSGISRAKKVDFFVWATADSD